MYYVTWTDEKFKSLSKSQPNAQMLWLFLLTNPNRTNCPGIIKAGMGMCVDYLKWEVKDIKMCFRELSEAGMVKVDWDNSVIYLPNWHKWNLPHNDKVFRGWLNALNDIPDCNLKKECAEQIKAKAISLGAKYCERFNMWVHQSPDISKIDNPPTKKRRIELIFFDLSKRYHQRVKKIYPNMRFLNDEKFDLTVNRGAMVLDRLHRLDRKSMAEIEAVLDYIIDNYDANKQFNWLRNCQSLNSIRNEMKNGIMKFEGVSQDMRTDYPHMKLDKDKDKVPKKVMVCTGKCEGSWAVELSKIQKKMKNAVTWDDVIAEAIARCPKCNKPMEFV